MRYQQDLRIGLRDRLARLLGVHYRDASTEIRHAVDWISRQPALLAILNNAEQAEQDLASGLEEWKAALKEGDLLGTQTEAGRTWLIWQVMQEMAADETGSALRPYERGFHCGQGSTLTDTARELVKRAFKPLFDYLSDQVAADSTILYHLERYQRRVEWFDREELYAQYKAVPGQKGEEVYDNDFRRFLFGEGINMPFSQAKSASGLSDVVAHLAEGEQPFIGEIKLFDAENRTKREIAKGVHQVIEYAHDWSANTGYLVVINLSGRQLQLPTDGPDEDPARYLDVGNVRVYMINVRALPMPSASKRGTAQPVLISRDSLLHPDES